MDEQTIDCLCLTCEKITTHKILCKCDIYDEGSLGLQDFLAQCLSCEETTYVRRSFYRDGPPDWDSGANIEGVFQFNFPRSMLKRNFSFLPEKIIDIYAEAIKVEKLDLPIVTGIALRAIAEAFCKEQKAKGNNLESKIKFLVKNGVLTEDQAKPLQKLRNIIGNKAAHDMYAPTREQITNAFITINNILKIVYETPQNPIKKNEA